MAFVAELRKRKVFQVAVGYLAVAWLVVQVAATILPAFDLPDWGLRMVVLLFALGFPVALLLAWALEITPEGVKLDAGETGSKRMLVIAAVLVAVALGWYFRSQLPPARLAPPTPPAKAVAARQQVDERSIAVLPLVNASNDPAQQFFSDGLSENLIDTLSRFDGLKVIGRISSFQLRDDKGDSAAIGAKLGVAYLLNGRVQREGDMVRIRASLTKASDGSILWAQHYDRPYKNLFALQDEIAQAVADALQVKLLAPAAAAQQDGRPPSGNLEAYDAYLQGLQYWHDERFPQAAQFMAKAVQLDPGYAMAWAHLSGSRSTTATFVDPPALAREHMDEARIAADKALQLAPELGAAHAARAYLKIYSFDYRGAGDGCRSAVQLAPEDATVLNGCGYVFAQVGNLGEAIRLREHLLSIEPLYIVNYRLYAYLLIATGRPDEAEQYLRTAESLPQRNTLWYSSTAFMRLTTALARGDAAAAVRIALGVPAEKRDLYAALAAQRGPDRSEADAALTTLLANEATANANPYQVAQVYALRGDAVNAVRWLDRAPTYDRLFLPTDPLMLRLRDDPRFIAHCRKIGLPPPGESDALNIDQIRALSTKPQARS